MLQAEVSKATLLKLKVPLALPKGEGMFVASRGNRGLIAAILVLTLARIASAAPSTNAQSSSAMTVSQILSRMAQNTKGLTSYEVPFHIDSHIKQGMFSVKVPLDGTRYFKVPDKSALKIPNVPSEAKELANVYSWLGTPQTWPSTYDITIASATPSGGLYELRATYKASATTHALLDKAAHSTVDHILLDVDSQTFDPVRASRFYQNGSTMFMTLTAGLVDGKYRLPQRESVDMKLPSHHIKALITYSTYQTNIPIPDATFIKPSS